MAGTYEAFHFDSLGELRDWLNQFQKIDLDTVLPMSGRRYRLVWEEQILSDGSSVFNAAIEEV